MATNMTGASAGSRPAVHLLVSPWGQAFDEFTRRISRSALLASPFIMAEPLDYLASRLRKDERLQIEILANLAVDSLVDRSNDPGAIARFCRAVPETRVWHLPGLHAKVYVADDSVVIVTSANLTAAGLNKNHEYGVWIDDTTIVARTLENLRAYAKLGSEVSVIELEKMANVAVDLHERHLQVLRYARATVRKEFEIKLAEAREALWNLRARPGESTNSIFLRTILYLLKDGPLSTEEMHPRIQSVHPDLCDDSIDRVINGVHFGRRWKHLVRGAQVVLNRQGLIRLEHGKWHLVDT